VALLLVSGCAVTSGLPSPRDMPEGMSFSGLWYSEQFEHMYLHQQGDQVEGVYAYGPGGQIRGEVRGNLLVFDWEEPGSREQVRRTMRGKGYLQLVESDDGYHLVGEWGYNEEHRGAGPWTADFIRSQESEDPRTVEAIRRIH
jgi:hypothetical protein